MKFKGGFTLDLNKKTTSEEFQLPYLPSDAAGYALETKIMKVSEHVIEAGKNRGGYYYKIVLKIRYEGRDYVRPMTYFRSHQIAPLLKFFKIAKLDSSEQLEGKTFLATFDTNEKTGYIESISAYETLNDDFKFSSENKQQKTEEPDPDDYPIY